MHSIIVYNVYFIIFIMGINHLNDFFLDLISSLILSCE